ncbi:ComF family protein [candidate division WWE3 bacterium]|uniref:ComF family protein n=1 Tax=candidate division WWE3 bacterium TaxID=2053526 RepID=A0A955LG97_UNCKA|nr:ComF family protein [candidate division WWE3 bacterium]
MFRKLLFPQRCVSCGKFDAQYLCFNCFQKIPFSEVQYYPVCEKPAYHGITHFDCQKKYSLDGHLSLTTYDGVVKDVVEFYKRRNVRKLELPIEKIMQLYLLGDAELFDWTIGAEKMLVPVPLFWLDTRLRNYNPAENIAHIASMYLECPVQTDVLEKIYPTRQQKKLSKQERRKNLTNSFGVSKNISADVIIVDDIWTTGATLRECAKVLKKAGALKVFGLTFARGH